MSRNTSREREKEKESEFIEKLVTVRRVAKVIKGGRRFSFSALVVVGDGKGRVGYATGKAREVPDAVKKATESARKKMVRVPLREGRTLHHESDGCESGRTISVAATRRRTASTIGGVVLCFVSGQSFVSSRV